MDSDLVKPQDQITLINFVSYNSIGRSLILDYIIENWDQLLERFFFNWFLRIRKIFKWILNVLLEFYNRFNTIPFSLSDLITTSLSSINSRYDLSKIDNFLKQNANNLGVVSETFREVKEGIQTNIRWMDKNFILVSNWLNENIKLNE